MQRYAWEPTPDRIAEANVTRLMRKAGSASIDELRRSSVADIDWYWDLVVHDLELPFDRPYERVRDSSAGVEWTKWFIGGQLNVATACVDRWRHDPDVADTPAVIHEDETGETSTLSYRELAEAVDRAAAGLRARGIGKGDAVGVFLPMIPEAVISAYAIAKVGALYVPLFSGFAASALASRLDDAQARLVITADWSWRRGRRGPMKPALDEALPACPSVETVVVVERADTDAAVRRGPIDVSWREFAAPVDGPVAAAPTSAEDPLLLGYTSGTTGRPKGAVHTHAGFLVKVASEVAYEFDLRRGDVFFWVTDMGWVMGPLSTFGTHALGGALLLYEGAPDTPAPDRLWQVAARHQVSMFGVSPTLVRALKAHGDELPGRHDLSGVRTFGSTGEPWDEDSYWWLSDVVGGGRAPIINFSGGTEIGGAFLAPFVVEPIRPCSLGGPSLGMDVDVFDASGRPVRGELGELVCRQPWPAMTRGVWGDPERYREAYWSTFPGVWRHGDWAKADLDGEWYLFGRSDEAINVAGKRVGPAEVESVLVAHPGVAEAAVIGVPDVDKGEAIWCYWTPTAAEGEDVSDELRAAIGGELGKPFTPARVLRVDALPKTRSAKIMRRAIRAVTIGGDPGDLSGAENPEALELIRTAAGSAIAGVG
ncbi:Acetyl-coenzyme A synthetase [Patulibacter medicamentivorans]|uniref:acetate--CoA ligase n=1 Tax=Patulibacter medicamentivorans TaxID=1097667 RepID=H0E5N0_9ACTN|nr:AMP-binding protein [Patulibacter medicamentivorans]EHN10993.1 Acetyl-coenzyme A synthetase [Patulibacter medicamentivorans]